MNLISLNIGRFGARCEIDLSGLAPHLNVVHGPNGSGKSTILAFLRWMVFGDADGAGGPFLALARGRAAGSLAVACPGQPPYTIVRTHGGASSARIHVRDGTGRSLTEADWAMLVRVRPGEYEHIFCPSFDRQLAVEDLISVAAQRGLEITYDERQLSDLERLESRLRQLEEDRLRLPGVIATRDQLFQMRSQLMAEAEGIEGEQRARRAQIDRQCHQLRSELADGRMKLAGLHEILSRLGHSRQTVQQQRQRGDRNGRPDDEPDPRQPRPCHTALPCEQQVHIWRQVLDQMSRRQQQLQAELQRYAPVGVQRTDHRDAPELADTHAWNLHLWDLARDVRDVSARFLEVGDTSELRWLPAAIDSLIATLRDEIGQLRDELNRNREYVHYLHCSSELRHLQRCQLELGQLIELLTSTHNDTGQEPTARAVGESSAAAVSSHSVLDARLRFFETAFEHVERCVRDRRLHLDSLQRQLELLEGSRTGEDRDLERVRAELDRIDAQLRLASQHDALHRSTIELETEIQRLRADLEPSRVVQEASSLLRQLTRGACRGLCVRNDRTVWVDQSAGTTAAYEQLSRGTRDLVYLSLALAVISEYRRRQIPFPLVLNDVFANIDSDRARATVDVLSQFAAQGNQILVFTRHEHVLELFSSQDVRMFSLQAASQAAAEDGAQERIAPRSASGSTSSSSVEPSRTAGTVRSGAGRIESSNRETADHSPATYRWVAKWDPADVPTSASADSAPMTGQDDRADIANPPLPLVDSSHLDAVRGLNPGIVAKLREIGVVTVGELVRLDPDAGQQRLGRYGITAQEIYRWQCQTSLEAHIGVTAAEAELLLACEIDDPEELAQIDVDDLYVRIDQRLTDAEARSRYGAISRYERPRLARWIERARQCPYRRYEHRDTHRDEASAQGPRAA